MRHFHWNYEKMQETWFEKEDVLRTQLGLSFDNKALNKMPVAEQAAMNSSLAKNNGKMCVICYEDFGSPGNPDSKPLALECGH